MKDNFLSKFLYGLCVLALIVLTAILIGLPKIVPWLLDRPSFSSHYYYIELLALLYITGFAAWLLVWETKNLAVNVIKRTPFSHASLKYLKIISLCAAFICVCYLITMLFINNASIYLIIEVTTTIVGSFMVMLIGGILYKLVEVATENNEEHDLTITKG